MGSTILFMPARIPIDPEAIAEFCKRHNIVKLSLFGSVLRDDFDPDRSDVDVLIDFEYGFVPSLFMLSRIQSELEDIVNRPVHLCRPIDLSRYFRDQVLTEAEVQYDAA